VQGYDYTADQLPMLIALGYFPEQPKPESLVIRDFLVNQGATYDRFSFSVRVGTPIQPDPTHLPAVQAGGVQSSLKRIDLLAWTGKQVTIVEAKIRISVAAIGQVLMYRELFVQEMPDVPEPRLVVIGRSGDPDVLSTHSAQGIDVYLYADAPAGG